MHSIFDSHAHYDDEAFDADRDTLLSETLPAAGVRAVMNAGASRASSLAGIALAQRYSFVYCAAGYHPQAALEPREGWLSELEGFLKQPKVMALGEIGLDYHYETAPRDVQKDVFEKQLALAVSLDVPVIIHSREATADTLELLRRYRPAGVVHCFSGSAETAAEVVRLGMYVGFTGVVTFKNANKAVKAAQAVPLDRMLVETDCPYMAPHPHRGKRCDSTLLPLTIEKLAQIKGIGAQEMASATAGNAARLYRIPLGC